MYEWKTKETDRDVIAFIETIDRPQKKKDSYALLDLFSKVSGFKPKMWGPSIIGFGSYHYMYQSGHEGEAPLVGFSPRKANISLYLTTDENLRASLLSKLGKHKSGKSCVYINKLDDIDTNVLSEFIEQTIILLKKQYEEHGSE